MKPLITVFTPTYNRKNYLIRIYESLLRQSDRRFVWLIVDDGSEDGTREEAEKFAEKNNGFDILYRRKENGGLYSAYESALDECNTPLFMCVDSDDWLTDDAVRLILNRYADIENNDGIAGLVAPNVLPDGTLIGGEMPNAEYVHIGELCYKYKHKGDVKMIYKTQILKQFVPLPKYDGEKAMNPCCLFMRCDEKYPLAVLHESVSVIDYSTNGMHTEVFAAYENSPRSFALLRILFMRDRFAPPAAVFRNAIHYVSSCIFAKDKDFLMNVPHPFAVLFAVPFGAALNLLVRIKNGGRRHGTDI